MWSIQAWHLPCGLIYILQSYLSLDVLWQWCQYAWVLGTISSNLVMLNTGQCVMFLCIKSFGNIIHPLLIFIIMHCLNCVLCLCGEFVLSLCVTVMSKEELNVHFVSLCTKFYHMQGHFEVLVPVLYLFTLFVNAFNSSVPQYKQLEASCVLFCLSVSLW